MLYFLAAQGAFRVLKELKALTQLILTFGHQRLVAHVTLLGHIRSLAAMRTNSVKIASAGRAPLPFALDFDVACRTGIIKRTLPPAHGAKLAVVADKRAAADTWFVVSRHKLLLLFDICV
jgi:hypothetical protein